MSAPSPIVIQAEVDPRERLAVVAGVQQLAEALRAGAGVDWPIQLSFSVVGGLVATTAGQVVVLSMLSDAEREESFADTSARWRSRVAALAAHGAPVLILTVFRAVPERATEHGQRLLRRIRLLDRMALDLSHEFGATVVDIDRAFAHIGARVMATDYRLAGRIAAEVAGYCLTLSLLTLGLDDLIAPDVQEKARAHHGPLREINALVGRRLAAA